ncbi:MAG: PEP-CTERM sorting domain-containing protein [Heteroscytonema crispum UTEX LB 1556]
MKKLSVFIKSNFLTLSVASMAIAMMSADSATAATLNLSFTKLQGLTGGNPAGTGVYRTDLSNIGFDINSIVIADSNNQSGGSPGKFSGFDLDAIKISRDLISNAADINDLPGLNAFDFSPGKTVFTPGTQRPTTDPLFLGNNFFGTNGNNINNSVATLQSFDGNSTTDANAFGYASLGDGGQVGFNFTSLLSTANPLYLYIGEVGDNEKVANGQITVSDKPITVPEPASLAALSLIGIYLTTRRSKKTNAV